MNDDNFSSDPGDLIKPAPQQKRQNSTSNYLPMSNKRTPNPLLIPLSMQNLPDSSMSPSTPSFPITNNYVNDMASPRITRSVRKNHLSQKTPTPSAYEVPSSPNVTNQNFDLPDSPKTDEPQNLSQPSHSQLHQQVEQKQIEQLQQQQRTMSEEEQQLATKLKDTYKNIVNYEEIVQKSCIEITIKINQISASATNSNPLYTSMNSSKTSELSNDLWTVYHHNVNLLDNYYDFLVTALKPSANQSQFKTGKNIVDLYKIPRRMWVYGIVGFLEVLKNIINIFQDHEICLCFIAYCFNIISNLTDPALEVEGWWCEKLGDLSRMAIALYSSRFIDWKISAEYWYHVSMKTLYGHGKIYYHMCTVQQDNLDALVNIGKSVMCRDPFVPTQQYLRLVVENICTQRNILSLLELPIIDFIKIHKVLLSIYNNNSSNGDSSNHPDSIHDTQLQYGIDLVTRYSLTFGSDSNGFNFFTRTLYTSSGMPNDPNHPYYIQQQQQSSAANTIEKMNFWFNKGPLFALANINHLAGFGDAKNPFAKIFQLPEALKERKDKKDRKRKSRTGSNPEDLIKHDGSVVDGQAITAIDLTVNDWFYCLNYINKSVIELSFRILNGYLLGPRQASTCHVIVWLYFLVAVGEASNLVPNSKNMFLWLFRKLFPWQLLINYLNSLLDIVKSTPRLSELCRKYLVEHPDYIQHFNENEFLPEVWKCWGTLWFDSICVKEDFNDLESAGVSNPKIFDLPICGTSPIVSMSNNDKKTRDGSEHDNDERIVRIILLARTLADNYDFGLVRAGDGFKFDANIYNDIDLLVSSDPNQSNIPYSTIEEFLFSDGRLVQNNFLIPVAPGNLVDTAEVERLTAFEKDNKWFNLEQMIFTQNGSDEIVELGNEIAEEEELEGYADSEYEEEYALNNMDDHEFYHQPKHLVLQQQHAHDLLQGFNDSRTEGNLGDRIDTNITHITLDTNIWLKHCGRIFKCIRNGVFKVLIPLIVFQELRSLRKSTEATIADAATRSVIIIRELYLTREILPLRFDGTVASDINETTEFENNSNWRTSVDETILNSVNEHDEIGKKLVKGINVTLKGPSSQENPPATLDAAKARAFRYCILVTDDRNMRLRAKTIGLVSFQSKWLFGQLEAEFGDRCID